MYNYVLEKAKISRLFLRDAWVTSVMISFLAIVIHQLYKIQSLLLTVGIALGYMLAYTLNDYYDSEEDARHEYKSKNNFFVKHRFSSKLALSLILMVLFAMLVIFSLFGIRGLGIYFISIISLWAYSAKPFKLRNLPIADIIIHATFILSYPYFVMLFLMDVRWTEIDYIIFSTFLISSIIIQLENQVRDFELDRQLTNNTTVYFGIKFSQNTIKFLTVILIFIAVYSFSIFDSLLIFLPFAIIYSPIIYKRLTSDIGEVRSERLIRFIIGLTLLYSLFLLIYIVVDL